MLQKCYQSRPTQSNKLVWELFGDGLFPKSVPKRLLEHAGLIFGSLFLTHSDNFGQISVDQLLDLALDRFLEDVGISCWVISRCFVGMFFRSL